MNTRPTAALKLRRDIKGIDRKVPVLNGRKSRYIYLDNAASTPPLQTVLNQIDEYWNWYSGVHRGTGYKSLISSKLYDECHATIARFVGADPDHDTVVLVKNTTDAINKLSYRLQLQPQDIVAITAMEHHSNELPWRARAQVRYIRVDENGLLDPDHLEHLFRQFRSRIKLVAVCGASNVTGHINDVHRLARIAHTHGCPILVDGAQLIPHRHFDMKPHSHSDHIDFLAFSSHKIFAPFGIGVLIGPRQTFAAGVPDYQGGGTVKLVTRDRIWWAEPPDKDEAGVPNVGGAFGLAATLKHLDRLGMYDLASYEEDLADYALEQLRAIRGLKIYGAKPRVGVIAFNLADLPHALVGAVMCFEAGIGLRTGCFCAQGYLRHLLGLSENDVDPGLYASNRLDKIPGMVRISLAPYNTREEIDILIKWLKILRDNKLEFRRRYRFSPQLGGYWPIGLDEESYFSLAAISL
ncbi:MAG: aminotransferase class V-fold PLP-dependent enzyme [Syntrophomonadaceae bacterium]